MVVQPNLVRFSDRRGLTPLLIASSFGQLDIIKWLFNKGICDDITEPSELSINHEYYDHNLTPLICATKYGHTLVVEWLFKKSLLIYLKTDGLLHLACQYGHLKTVIWLIEKGNLKNNIKKLNHDGKTPMYMASLDTYNFSVALWLIFHGAVSDSNHHIDHILVLRDICHCDYYSSQITSSMLLDYCSEKIKQQYIFLIMFLYGFQCKTSYLYKCFYLLDEITCQEFKMLISDYVGIERGNNLRIIKELSACLLSIINIPGVDSSNIIS